MFKHLKNKWKVSWLNFSLIFCTFAIGGSLTGYVTRKLFKLTSLEPGFLKGFLYVLVITAIWPFMVLFISVFFGQFNFFKRYVGNLLAKFMPKKN